LDKDTDIFDDNKTLNNLWPLIVEHNLQAITFSLINKNLEKVPHSIAERSHRRAKKKMLRKMKAVKDLSDIQEAHHKKGITIIPYKGLSLGYYIYDDIYMRDFKDIDFAIAKEDIKASADIMQSLGYKEIGKQSNFSQLKKSRTYFIDYSWVKYDTHNNIISNAEIHWQPTNYALYYPDTFEDLQSKSKTSYLLNKEIKLFDKMDNIILMIIHHGLVDNWFQMRHLLDLVLAVRNLTDQETEQLVAILKQKGLLKTFHYGIKISQDLFNIDYYNRSIPNLAFYQLYLSQIKAGKYVGKWSENKLKIFYYFLMRQSNIDRLKSLASFLKYSIRSIGFASNK